MTVSITPLASALIIGTVPRSGVTRVKTLDQAKDAPLATWARTQVATSDVGHYLYQKLLIDPRMVQEWKHFKHQDPSQYERLAREHTCCVYGASWWTPIYEGLAKVRAGDMSPLQEITLLENHAESDPDKTRLMVCGRDYVPWAIAALRGIKIEAWVGFSAVLHDSLRFDGRPSMCGLTAELARKVH